MKKYNVTVNGNTYEVEVEEVSGDFSNKKQVIERTESITGNQTGSYEVKKEKIEEKPPKASDIKAISEGEKIECPMPGTILKVNVNVGDSVKKGDVLVILEAMKMENEIMAPHDGKIVQVYVSKGASVNTGDALITIE